MSTIANKKLYAGVLSDTETLLYAAPSNTGDCTIIKAITLCNKTAITATATLKFAGIELICQHAILPYDTITIPFLDQVLNNTETIYGSSGTADSINCYISGKEVTV